MKLLGGGEFLISTTQPEDIFTPEDMSTNQKLIAQILEDFLRGEVEPQIKELEAKNEGLMLDLLKKAATMGWLGVDIPKKFGGFGLDTISSLIVTEQLSRGGPFAIANLVHTSFGTLPILFFGNSEQKNRYLPELANGKKIAAFALTEPDAGSNALDARTTAILSEDRLYYILNGSKQFISNTGYADVFIVFAKIDGEKFTAFIVDKDSKGLSLGEEEDKMGIRGTSTRSLSMENVRIPVQNLLFQIGKGHIVAFNTLNIGRFKLSGGCVGFAKVAFEDSIRYAKSRVQFGQPISNFGLIKEKIGDIAIRIFVAESMIYRTSSLIEEGLKNVAKSPDETGFELAQRIEEYAIECSINKVYASEMLNYVVDEAVQIHGGYGYIKDYAVERYYRDARIYRIFGGTNEINRLLILRTLLRRTTKDQLPLIKMMEEVASEMLTPPVEGHSQRKGLEGLANLVGKAKKIALLSMNAVIQAYPNDLEHQQELIGRISDIIIEVFAMESSLLRAQKIRNKLGEGKDAIPAHISDAYISDAFLRVEYWARLIFAATSEGDMLRTRLSNLRGFAQCAPVNLIALRRKIAENMLQAGRYWVS